MTLQTTIKSVLVLRQRFRLIQLGFSLGDQSFEFLARQDTSKKRLKQHKNINNYQYGIGSVSLFKLQVCTYQVTDHALLNN